MQNIAAGITQLKAPKQQAGHIRGQMPPVGMHEIPCEHAPDLPMQNIAAGITQLKAPVQQHNRNRNQNDA
jgi:hypothetical protein